MQKCHKIFLHFILFQTFYIFLFSNLHFLRLRGGGRQRPPPCPLADLSAKNDFFFYVLPYVILPFVLVPTNWLVHIKLLKSSQLSTVPIIQFKAYLRVPAFFLFHYPALILSVFLWFPFFYYLGIRHYYYPSIHEVPYSFKKLHREDT